MLSQALFPPSSIALFASALQGLTVRRHEAIEERRRVRPLGQAAEQPLRHHRPLAVPREEEGPPGAKPSPVSLFF